MDGGAWWATVHGVTQSHTQLSDFTFFLLFQYRGQGFNPWSGNEDATGQLVLWLIVGCAHHNQRTHVPQLEKPTHCNPHTTTRKTHTLRPRATTTEPIHCNYWTDKPQLEKLLHSTPRKSLSTAMKTQWAKTKSKTNNNNKKTTKNKTRTNGLTYQVLFYILEIQQWAKQSHML